MQVTPWLMGACAIASISGAVAGASLGSTPIQNRTDPLDEIIARQPVAPASARVVALAGGPDHYALETPDGRIDVRDLESRGLYRDRPERPASLLDAAITEPRMAAEQIAAPAAEPAVLLAAAEPVRRQGGSRMIDVGAELAAR